MTYILSSIYDSGAVIIGDRKTLSIDGSFLGYDEKLFYDFPIVVGSSGTMSVSKKFRAEIKDYLAKGEISSINQFMEDIEDIAEEVTKRYRYIGDFDSLICVQIGGSARIIQLNYYECGKKITEEVEKYSVIGSGESCGRIFLKHIWKENMTMWQIAELGHFVIKCIERFGLDMTVGVNDKGPQIWFVPNSGNIFEIDKTSLGRLELLTQSRLARYAGNIDNLFNVGDQNIDWIKLGLRNLTKKETRIMGIKNLKKQQ